MAQFIVNADDGNTPQHHAMRIWHDSLADTVLARLGMFGAKGSGKPIVIDRTLTGKAGEDVIIHFVPYADVEPILGQDADTEGNESSIDEFNLTVSIDEVKFAFKRKGNMTVQRTILNLREIFRTQIFQHFAQYNETELFKRAAGIAQTETSSGWESATNSTDRVNSGGATSNGRCIRADGSSSYSLVTQAGSDNVALISALAQTDKMNVNLVYAAGIMARKKAVYKMTPLRVANGKEWYMLFMSDESQLDLITDPNWFARSLSVEKAGLDNDAIALGSIGTIGHVICHSSEHVPKIVATADTDEYARNILFGREGVTLAWAQTLDYNEYTFPYAEAMGVKGNEIRGEVKNTFTNKDDTSTTIDYGVAQVITASTL